MRQLAVVVGAGIGLLGFIASAHAEDAIIAPEAEAGEITHEQMLGMIDAMSENDPELAAEMRQQYELMQQEGQPLESRELALNAPTEPGADITSGAPRLVGPPVEGTQPPTDPDVVFDQVNADPRMLEARQQYESGQLTEGQALERVVEVLRDHGVEPNQGHEWDGVEGVREGLGPERGVEQMSPEAREQMERAFLEHDSEHHELDREAFEHYFEMPETGMMDRGMEREAMEAPLHDLEAPVHDMEAPLHEMEAPTHEMEAFTHEYEAPMHELEAPQFEAPTHEIEAPIHEYEAPEAPEAHEMPEAPMMEGAPTPEAPPQP